MKGGRLQIDSKVQAKRCSVCSAWPAPIRPAPKVALCEECARK